MISGVASAEHCYYRGRLLFSCSCLRLLSMIQCLVRMSWATSWVSFRGRWAVPLCCSCGSGWKSQHRRLILTSVHTHTHTHPPRHTHTHTLTRTKITNASLLEHIEKIMGLLAVIYTVVKQPASCVGVSAAAMVTLLHPRLRLPHLLSWLDSLLNVSKMKYKEPQKKGWKKWQTRVALIFYLSKRFFFSGAVPCCTCCSHSLRPDANYL